MEVFGLLCRLLLLVQCEWSCDPKLLAVAAVLQHLLVP